MHVQYTLFTSLYTLSHGFLWLMENITVHNLIVIWYHCEILPKHAHFYSSKKQLEFPPPSLDRDPSTEISKYSEKEIGMVVSYDRITSFQRESDFQVMDIKEGQCPHRKAGNEQLEGREQG